MHNRRAFLKLLPAGIAAAAVLPQACEALAAVKPKRHFFDNHGRSSGVCKVCNQGITHPVHFVETQVAELPLERVVKPNMIVITNPSSSPSWVLKEFLHA